CDPHPIIWDFGKQQMIGSLDQTGKGDQVTYDAKYDIFLLGEAGWTHGPHIGIVGGTPIKFITNVVTTDGNHNNAVVDDTNDVVYAMGGKAMLSFPLPAVAKGAAGSAGAQALGLGPGPLAGPATAGGGRTRSGSCDLSGRLWLSSSVCRWDSRGR